MAENNTTCAICGKAYHLCMSCKDKLRAEPWKVQTDTSEHYKILAILCGFNSGVYTKDEAREKLLNVDLSDKPTLKPDVIKQIDSILKNDVKDNSKTITSKRKKKVVGNQQNMVNADNKCE